MSVEIGAFDTFARRHIGPSEDEIAEMLRLTRASSLEDLIAETVPASIRLPGRLDLPPGLSEHELLARARALGSKNRITRSFIGTGYSDTHHPAGDPAQHPREPRLVHRLYPLSGRDLARPSGSPAQLPDPDPRSDRLRGGRCIAAG